MMRTTGIQEMFLATFLTGFTLTAMAELAGNQLHIIFPTKKISSQCGTMRLVRVTPGCRSGPKFGR